MLNYGETKDYFHCEVEVFDVVNSHYSQIDIQIQTNSESARAKQTSVN